MGGGNSKTSSALSIVVSSKLGGEHAAAALPRRVTFKETRTVISIDSVADFSEAQKEAIWYNEDEIEAFKTRARKVCIQIRGASNNNEANNTNDTTQKEETGDVRGLELRISQDRQRRKYMIIHAILRAQRRYKDPQQLSNIARKCSVWSKVAATIEAQRDYCSLYEPTRVTSIPLLPPLEKYPLPFKSKDPPPLDCIPIKRPISPRPITTHCNNTRPRPAPFAMSC